MVQQISLSLSPRQLLFSGNELDFQKLIAKAEMQKVRFFTDFKLYHPTLTATRSVRHSPMRLLHCAY
jgi:hypothetical protein